MIGISASRWLSVGLFVALSCATGGCSQVLGIENTTQAAPDSGTSLPPEWACVGHQPALGNAPSTITITAQITNFLTGDPVPGLSLEVCKSPRDPTCAGPIGPFTSDAQGLAKLTIPTSQAGFDGYVRVTGKVQVAGDGGTHTESIVPYLWYFSRPLVADGKYPLAIFSTSGFGVILGALGATPDPKRGHLSVEVDNCLGKDAPGVKLDVDTADAKSTSFYVVDGLPTHKADRTKDGIAGFLNLPTGIANIKTTPDAIGIPDAEKSVFVEAGTLTTMLLSPNQ